MPDDTGILSRRVHSAPELKTYTNYDDICGPWKFDSVPLHGQCNHLSFKLITSEDITYMREQRDRESILQFLEEKILSSIPYKKENKEILAKLLWQTFRFFKIHQNAQKYLRRIKLKWCLNFFAKHIWKISYYCTSFVRLTTVLSCDLTTEMNER
ncbi:PREDICTED: uncharacterized protein LOC105452445 isoform X3 [Wasmannia auropunctata]|uniref:uncharacterized protein LOC105452445 isoform X3 n=1 Tax=Wasmannia auropunctata TaxID=64793 RepID=UPI0005EF50DA|nr:PREDICTED: uncharacterized protein LOC105452445 isoform X3 [Wasmannia auropunctata]